MFIYKIYNKFAKVGKYIQNILILDNIYIYV